MVKEIIAVEEKVRLDAYLAKQDIELSRSMIQKLLEDKKIIVNGKIEKSSYKVQIGDKIQIEVEPPKKVKLEPQETPLNIVYEDKDAKALIDRIKKMN